MAQQTRRRRRRLSLLVIVASVSSLWMMITSLSLSYVQAFQQQQQQRAITRTVARLPYWRTAKVRHGVRQRGSAKPLKPSSSILILGSSIGGGLEDLVFNIQSTASDLAAYGLGQQPPSGSSGMLLLIMYVAGLLTSFSPCVWGLLPITMSYIGQAADERGSVGDNKGGNKNNTLMPTIAFAAGLASVFCTLGIVAALFGGSTGMILGGDNEDNPLSLVLSVMSNLICLLMGLKLLELIQIPLPSFDVRSWFASQSSMSSDATRTEVILVDGTGRIMKSSPSSPSASTKTGDDAAILARTFLLGGSSALVASPCSTPVLTSILACVAQGQCDAIAGAGLLLTYTLGYCTPLLYVASKGSQFLIDMKKKARTGDVTSSEGNSMNWNDMYGRMGPWITPITGGILLWYGTNGMLVAIFGDPSLAGLAPVQ